MQTQVYPADSDAPIPEIKEFVSESVDNVSYYPNTGTLDFKFKIGEFKGMDYFDAPDGFGFNSAYVHPKTNRMVVTFKKVE